jgi:hypothetical protein
MANWEPAEKVQKNAAGEFRAMIGGEWVPVAKAQKNAAGEYRIDRGQDPARQVTRETVQPSAGQESDLDQLGGAAVATGAGLLKGAADIGATILSPFDALGLSGYTPSERRAKLEEFAAGFKRPAFTAGEITSQIAGTAGAGGALAQGVRRAAPLATEAAAALESGGMARGLPFAQRLAGGAISGGAQAGLVNPKDAAIGAQIGAALPAGMQAITRGVPTALTGITGMTTGVGDEPIKQAFQAGKRGGKSAEAFKANIRGEANMLDVLDTAKQDLSAMNAAKSAEYRANMQAIKSDKSVLDFAGVDQSIVDAFNTVTFKGQVKNQKGAEVLTKISDAIGDWKSLPPSEYHTPEGLDALKQSIGGIVDSIPMEEKTARKVGTQIYNSIKAEISKQAPEYSKTMKSYSDATETIRDIEKSLSIGQKASADTSMRKLQSLMRNNVSTNYGQRQQLAKELEQVGGGEIMPALAGQAMSELAPRGLARIGGGLAAGGAVLNPATLAALPFASPRLVGETAYGLGSASRGVNRLSDLAQQQVPMQGLDSLTRAAIINALANR